MEDDPLRVPTNARARLRAARKQEVEQLYYNTYSKRISGPIAYRDAAADVGSVDFSSGEKTSRGATRSFSAGGYKVTNFGKSGCVSSVITPMGEVCFSDPCYKGCGPSLVPAPAVLRLIESSTLNGRRVNHCGQTMDKDKPAMSRIINGDFYCVRGNAIPEVSDVVPVAVRRIKRDAEVTPKIGLNRCDTEEKILQTLVMNPISYGTAEVDVLAPRRTAKHMRFSTNNQPSERNSFCNTGETTAAFVGGSESVTPRKEEPPSSFGSEGQRVPFTVDDCGEEHYNDAYFARKDVHGQPQFLLSNQQYSFRDEERKRGQASSEKKNLGPPRFMQRTKSAAAKVREAPPYPSVGGSAPNSHIPQQTLKDRFVFEPALGAARGRVAGSGNTAVISEGELNFIRNLASSSRGNKPSRLQPQRISDTKDLLC